MDRRPSSRRPLRVDPPVDPPADPGPDGPAGLFGPDSEGWRLNREAALLLVAGPRALLMQVAHPLIAEGVDQHSSFRENPWRRLTATMTSSLRLLYGDVGSAHAELAHLRRLHATIRGPVRDDAARARHGKRYSARDPGLGFWVLATLIDATIAGHEALVGPVEPERRERFYAEGRWLAALLDIPARAVPPDLAGFEAYLAEMLAPDGPIQVGPTARSIGAAILRPPLAPLATVTRGLDRLPGAGALLGVVPAAAYSWLYWPAVSTLPERVRDGYGIAWGPRERVVAEWLLTSWRAWLPFLPGSLRWLPQARAAYRRVGLSSPA
ncbi:MAG: DUF2236 domain-containing protein [Chloroflexi bacterium]|nr:DUF2236 domain-containing protein [Chloroflexota bacterium]